MVNFISVKNYLYASLLFVGIIKVVLHNETLAVADFSLSTFIEIRNEINFFSFEFYIMMLFNKLNHTIKDNLKIESKSNEIGHMYFIPFLFFPNGTLTYIHLFIFNFSITISVIV